MTLQARLEFVIWWLYRNRSDPGRIPRPICWLQDLELRRCHLVPVSLARYDLLEMDGERVLWRIGEHQVLRDNKTITVLPSERFQHDTPTGTFRIRRFDSARCGWLVYR